MKNKEFAITHNLYASQGQRFINFMIDLAFIYIIVLSIGTTIYLIADIVSSFSVSNWIKTLGSTEILLYGFIIMFLYYFLTETYFSRTFAKLITKTVVVRKDGTKPSNKMFFIRALARFIPFEPLSVLGDHTRGWHDILSGTYVVKKKKLAKKMKLFYSPDEFGKV